MSRSGRKKTGSKKTGSKILRCPTCRKLVTAKDPEFPFCSEHCRTIDLGKWASGAYVISSPIFDPNILENLDEIGKRSSEDE